jgi:4-oxalocrotonate tautomerase
MPYVNIQIVGSATREQKERLVAEVTESLVSILNKDRDRTTVVIQEVASENWGIGGLLRDDWVRRKEAGRDD